MDARLSILVVVCATILVALGHLAGDAWVGLIVGVVLPSPVVAAVRTHRDDDAA